MNNYSESQCSYQELVLFSYFCANTSLVIAEINNWLLGCRLLLTIFCLR